MINKHLVLAISLIFMMPHSSLAQGVNDAPRPNYARSAGATGAVPYGSELAGQQREQSQTMFGSFKDSLQESLNPCHRDYSVILDGWQEVAVQDAIQNWIFWLAIILLGAVAVLGFDDYFRKSREHDVREAVISSSLVLMNDRNMLLRRTKDAIRQHNNLVIEIDGLKRQSDDNGASQTKLNIAAAFNKPVSQSKSDSLSDILGDDAVSVNVSESQPYTRENAAPIVEDEESETAQKSGSESLIPYKLGGKMFMIEPELGRHIKEMQRKIQNLSTNNRIKDEKLRKFGE
jgi:hypothetical protein